MKKHTIETPYTDAIPPYTARPGGDDEINLVDLWLVVRRRWVWVLAGLLAGIFAAIAYNTLTVPVYESRAGVWIGKIHEVGAIEDFESMEVRLIEQYGPESGDGAERRMPHLKSAAKAPRRANILELVAVAHSPDEARAFLALIVAELMQRHEQTYASAIDPLRRRLATIDQQIGPLMAQVEEFGDLIARLKEAHPVQASLVAIERSRLSPELNELARDRVSLQQAIVPPRSHPSEVIEKASLPNYPVSPRQAVAMVIGIALGLVMGLLAVFFREFFENVQAAIKPDRCKVQI